jgi:hypothetical protein
MDADKETDWPSALVFIAAVVVVTAAPVCKKRQVLHNRRELGFV